MKRPMRKVTKASLMPNGARVSNAAMKPQTIYVSPSKWAAVKKGKTAVDYMVVCARADHVDCAHDRKVAELCLTDNEADAIKARKRLKKEGPVILCCVIYGYVLQAIFQMSHFAARKPRNRKPLKRLKHAVERLQGWRMTEASAAEWRKKWGWSPVVVRATATRATKPDVR